MRRLLSGCILIFILSLAACTSAKTAGNEESSGFFSSNKPELKIMVPAGTSLRVVLQQGVGTDTSTPGSEFSAVLAAPLVVDGKTVLEQGTAVSGRVVDVKKAGRVKGRATLSLALTSVERAGQNIPIETRTYVGVAKDNKSAMRPSSAAARESAPRLARSQVAARARLQALPLGAPVVPELCWLPAAMTCTTPRKAV